MTPDDEVEALAAPKSRSRWPALLFTAAAALLCASAFLLYTLILEENYIEHDTDAMVNHTATIGVPALTGMVLAAAAIKLSRKSCGSVAGSFTDGSWG